MAFALYRKNLPSCSPKFASQASQRIRNPVSRISVRASAQSVDQRAAETRWENQLREGKVINVSCKDAADLQKQGWVLLDVRPSTEASKVPVIGAVHVPLFVEDPDNSLGGLLKKWAFLGTGGFWLGGSHMMPNTQFMQQVQQAVSKDARVVVMCQKGLRSLASCEQLSNAGYKNIAWINGGLDTCRKGDLPTQGDVDIRYAGIGGLSEVLGWTEVQEAENKQQLGGSTGVLKVVALILLADALLFVYENYQAYMAGSNKLLGQ
ncbi:hypothetical protein CEUSTIGMA_g12095.t1 [Chlamydomonas eustigma]|uniref:Rhodanese domain-containing protein n=1 Tax=Chlamydomonas eustigma TaxID=1157962 RepID=A0A250XNK5_9CHLO|nr:hypothetical protein CEUSTIGMA_g12095.t1 [Chlamydomonas eustigma]|eukprot:GAX84674.1 hypothetical protein CEUSTIGMA_g12095.t1 [Chlamydomonas eustigma]